MAQIRFVEVRHRARRFPVPALSAAVALAGCWLKEDEQRFELEHQIENSVSPGNVVGERMLVDVAVGQSFMLLQLLSHEDKLLLGTRRALFCLDLLFHFLDGVRALNLDGDCLDLEVAWTPEFPMPGRPQLKQQLAPALFPVFSLAILSGLLCVTAAPGWDAKSFAERRKVVSKRWY
eukprot:CAMPEP_0177743558 /NCGR_PEP_ID=MMETSP0484_2-20121128/29258_1 /TAXON_ID=354590 /ORGANISM="Rhodomonas lens, Strain RHODO" /LENGTH=176 /DNA_ID=CAMNT_0019257965 /DNA_START=382 /DNA_END=913 /DNA_ORIENTATION=-